MARIRIGAASLLAAWWVLSSPTVARAEPVQVSYRAPAGCPSEADFLERVRSRVQHARFAEAGQPAHTFEVTVGVLDGAAAFLGRLEFVDSDGQRVERSLKGEACDELASGLALITALALDDRIAEAPPDEASPPPSPPPAAPSAPTQKENPAPQPATRLPEALERSPRSTRLRVDLGLEAGVLSWVTASAARQLGLYAELGSRVPSWSVRLSAFDVRRTSSGPVGSADFVADWLRFEACPVALRLRSHFALSPCIAFDAGQLRGTAQASSALTPTAAQDVFWAAGVALVRVSWVYQERLVFGVAGELGVPFVRRSFVFRNPDGSLLGKALEVPSIGLGANFGVALRFP